MSSRHENFADDLERIEKRAQGTRLLSLAITIIPVLIALIALFITIYQIKRARNELNQVQTELNETRAQHENLSQELIKKREDVKNIAAILNLSPDELIQLYNYGWKGEKIKTADVNPALVKESFKAQEELNRLVQTTDSGRRKEITIAYFPKTIDVDAAKFEDALKGFGFNLVRSPSRVKDAPTNVVFFGDKVNPDDVKIVAYTLMRAGVQLKGIFRFKKDTTIPLPEGTTRDSLIAVAANNVPGFLNRPPLTIESIRDTKEFTTISY
jgi:hypothetical protein